MKKQIVFSLLIALSAICNAQVKTIHNAELVTVTLRTVTPALKDIPEKPLVVHAIHAERDNPELEREVKGTENPFAKPIGMDPSLQRIYSDTSSTNIDMLSNWQGLSASVDPSDNTLAVGPNHVMQMTNSYSSTYIRIWNKAGDVLINSLEAQDITGFSDYGDPNVIYDAQADRFIFVLLDGFSNKLIVACSQTNDPTGSYYAYDFATTGGFPDYPKIAVWGNSYFITTNSNSPTIFALNREAILAGNPIGIAQRFTLESFGTIGFQSASPVTFTGSIPAAEGSPAIIMRVADDAWSGIDEDHLEVYEIHVDWVDPDLSTLTGSMDIATSDFNSNLCGFASFKCIPEPSSPQQLDPLSNIIMDKAQYRNFGDHESIVCSYVCNVGGGIAGVRWCELRKNISGSWIIYQEGTYSPDDDYRWMSSITINQFGTIALGYNISSEATFPGIRLTGRAQCDSLNIMTAPEAIAQIGSSFNSSYRYGDYNAMVTDPVDGSFWFTGNYNPSTNWATKVIHFSIDSCTVAPIDTTIIDTTNDAVAYLYIQNLQASPIPASQYVELAFGSTLSENITMQVIDATGKLILSRKENIVTGANTITIPVATLASGYYIIKLQTSKGNVTQKLIVQHE